MSQPQYQIGSPLPAMGCASLLLITFFMCLMPFMLVDVMHTALTRLHLSATMAMVTLLGIFIGSVVNIPVYRMQRTEQQPVVLYGPLMVGLFSDRFRTMRMETVIAVNLGGCVIPTLLAGWQILHVGVDGGPAWTALVIITAANIAVCYFVARPVPGIGIMMPGFVSPLAAVGLTWMLLSADSPDRAPVAFVAGVLGPVVGADLLHLKDLGQVSTGMLSIGGAGTFDGIVLSGVLAAILV
jgi:uncharacterized membrane protein